MLDPAPPVTLPGVKERCMTPAVFDVQQIGTTRQEHVDELKVRGWRPTSIVERRTAIIVPDFRIDPGFVD